MPKEDWNDAPERGRHYNQQMKAYYIYDYLKKFSDNNHIVRVSELIDEMKEIGIHAERKSVYRDIDQINRFFANDFESEKLDDDDKIIRYDEHQKGYYYAYDDYLEDEFRLVAEAIYCAKFLDRRKSQELIDLICENVSPFRKGNLKHSARNIDARKTDNKETFANISKIDEAMALQTYDGEPHEPEKIKFNYLKHTINDVRNKVDRRKGESYIVSPYELIINDGNYYLRAFDEKLQKMMTYRLDRMRNIKLLGEPRSGEEAAAADIHNYESGMFGMYGGEKKTITMQFPLRLLDTIVERFGNDFRKYHKVGDWHFTITTEIEVSPQFYGWLCGFGKNAVIVSPEDAKADFKAFVKGIEEKY